MTITKVSDDPKMEAVQDAFRILNELGFKTLQIGYFIQDNIITIDEDEESKKGVVKFYDISLSEYKW